MEMYRDVACIAYVCLYYAWSGLDLITSARYTVPTYIDADCWAGRWQFGFVAAKAAS